MGKFSLAGWMLGDVVSDGGKDAYVQSVKLTDAAGTAITISTAGLPASTGQKTSALSMSTVLASDATLPAFAAIPTFKIDQTTPGTTNGTVPAGGVASGATDSGNPIKVAGKYNATKPTFTDGQRGDMQIGTRGALATQLQLPDNANAAGFVGAGSDNVSNASLNCYSSNSYPNVFNGTTWDRAKKTNLYKRVASSAASGNPDFLKASAGDVTKFWGLCGATAVYLQIYNKASAPTIGTDTPIITYPCIANAPFTDRIEGGGYFTTGIAFAFTTDAAGTTASAAAAVTAFMLMGA